MARSEVFERIRRLARLAWSTHQSGRSAQGEMDRALEAAANRREFLRSAAGAAMVATVPWVLPGCDKDGGDGATDGGGGGGEHTVAVVGAGMAGVHCAYRLQQAGVNVRVFDAADRVGGRMFTARGVYPEGQIAELGGELIDSNHVTLLSLAQELEIQLDDLFAGEPAGFARESWFFDGRHVPDADIVEAFRPLAAKMAAAVEAAEADDDLFETVDAMSISEWLAAEGADPLIRELLEIAYVGEYGLEADEQSIFNLLYLIDYDEPDPFRVFGDSDEQFHAHEGSDSFPTRLADRLERPVELGHRLMAAAALPDGRYRLTFDRGGSTVEETVDRVVFALPFTLLREVDLSGLDLPEEKREIIAELGYGTNAKLMGGFTRRVWRDDHNAAGSTITDNGLQFLWDTSRGQDGESAILTNFVGGRRGVEIGQGTPEDQMATVVPLVEQIFPGSAAAYRADSATRMHWPTAPFAKASYTCYKPGQWAWWQLEGQRVGNLHFCGEHTSAEFQGYMEGAAETGALVATEIIEDLGLGMPSALRRALTVKLELPQATRRGFEARKLRWMQRRRIVRRVAALRRV